MMLMMLDSVFEWDAIAFVGDMVHVEVEVQSSDQPGATQAPLHQAQSTQ